MGDALSRLAPVLPTCATRAGCALHAELCGLLSLPVDSPEQVQLLLRSWRAPEERWTAAVCAKDTSMSRSAPSLSNVSLASDPPPATRSSDNLQSLSSPLRKATALFSMAPAPELEPSGRGWTDPETTRCVGEPRPTTAELDCLEQLRWVLLGRASLATLVASEAHRALDQGCACARVVAAAATTTLGLPALVRATSLAAAGLHPTRLADRSAGARRHVRLRTSETHARSYRRACCRRDAHPLASAAPAPRQADRASAPLPLRARPCRLARGAPTSRRWRHQPRGCPRQGALGRCSG